MFEFGISLLEEKLKKIIMENVMMFISTVTFIAIVLEMYRIKKLVKNQEEIIKLQKDSINQHKKTELIFKEMMGNYEKLNRVNDKIIASLKK